MASQEQQPSLAEALSSQAAATKVEAEPVQKAGFFSKLASMVTFGGSKKASACVQRRASFENEMDRNLSCEEMDSDDLGGGLNLSDCEDGANERGWRREFKANKRAVNKEKKAKVFRQEFDTNVFEVALNCLADKGQMATGDAEFCTFCQAVFS